MKWWTRWRYWLALLVVLALAAVVVGSLAQSPSRPLDPSSTASSGSRALARLLERYGTRVAPGDGLAARSPAVLLTDPDAYSDAQLRRLASGTRHLVAVQPGSRAAGVLVANLEPSASRVVDESPGCDYPGAQAAGSVALPADSMRYVPARGARVAATRCYGGAVVVARHVIVLGSAQLLENGALARRGVAALAINVVSADRTIRSVAWLRPGSAAAGPGPTTVWSLFPAGAQRVVLWLLVVGLLAVLWRARRLGPAVRERLPVVVRSAEIVEGHGRLYERAGARERAAGALRAASTRRLAARLALPRGASPPEVAASAASRLDRPAGELWAALDGPPPTDDAALARLAAELEQLETAVTEKGVR